MVTLEALKAFSSIESKLSSIANVTAFALGAGRSNKSNWSHITLLATFTL